MYYIFVSTTKDLCWLGGTSLRTTGLEDTVAKAVGGGAVSWSVAPSDLTFNFQAVEDVDSHSIDLQLTGALPRHLIQDEGAARKRKPVLLKYFKKVLQEITLYCWLRMNGKNKES